MKNTITITLFFIITSCASFGPDNVKYTRKDVQCNSNYKIYENVKFKIAFNDKFRYRCTSTGVCYDSKDEIDTFNTQKFLDSREKTSEIKKEWNEKTSCINFVNKKEEADYIVNIDINVNEEGSLLWAALTGASLFLIPMKYDMNYELNYELKSTKKDVYFKRKLNYETTGWAHLFLLPVMPFYNQTKTNKKMDGDFLGHVYQDIRTIEKSNKSMTNSLH